VETAAKARALAEAMAPAPPPPPPEPGVEIVQDRYAELAATLERGMWIEFEGEDGQLAFAKLAWVSPLRGTYLFTNRQGQKAVSLTADELADRFRKDRARLVEAEPLVDRALRLNAPDEIVQRRERGRPGLALLALQMELRQHVDPALAQERAEEIRHSMHFEPLFDLGVRHHPRDLESVALVDFLGR